MQISTEELLHLRRALAERGIELTPAELMAELALLGAEIPVASYVSPILLLIYLITRYRPALPTQCTRFAVSIISGGQSQCIRSDFESILAALRSVIEMQMNGNLHNFMISGLMDGRWIVIMEYAPGPLH